MFCHTNDDFKIVKIVFEKKKMCVGVSERVSALSTIK